MAQAHSIDRIKNTIEAEAQAGVGVTTELQRPTHDEPAVGLVANGGSGGDVAAAILRAKRAGFDVIVAYDPVHVDDEILAFARHLGGEVVGPESGRLDDLSPLSRLRRTARSAGYPGVILQRDLSTRIDYESSATRLEEESEYLVDAEPVSAVTGSPSVLIGVPAFNEAGSIREVVDGASQYGTVLVVDDGSDDDTAAIARSSGAAVVEHGGNRGYGAALKTLFEEADRAGVRHLVVIDGDGQHEPEDIPKLLSSQRDSDAELVIGSRFAEGAKTDAPIYRLVGLYIVNLLTNLSLGVIRSRSRVGDTQSGFRVYDRRAIESLATDDSIGTQMGASTDILYHAHHHDFEITEVGTSIYYDIEESSSQNPITHGLSLVNNILVTVERDRPILTLGLPGVVGALAGAGFGYWTIANFIQTGTFPIGTALVSTFFLLAGILACLTAVILHSLNTYLMD